MEWTNWSGWVRCAAPEFRQTEKRSEIVAAVRDGMAPVRVVGTGHSFTALGETRRHADLARRLSGRRRRRTRMR